LQELLRDHGFLHYWPNFIGAGEAQELFIKLRSSLSWRQDQITLYGKTHPIPRLQAFYGDQAVSYTYSRIELQALPWTPELIILKARLEQLLQQEFGGVLCNLYRHGRDYAAWHADNEPILGPMPTIASLSFGAIRQFQLKKRDGSKRFELELETGSLLVMSGELQAHWVHQLKRTSRPVGERINLTFRPFLIKP
jgi:alkylated DNA repair dioxygenase AlkB